jgi:hypothetical protein
VFTTSLTLVLREAREETRENEHDELKAVHSTPAAGDGCMSPISDGGRRGRSWPG